MRRAFLSLLLGVGAALLMPTQASAQYYGGYGGYGGGCSGYECMSCGQLWYERNAIFARKGYCFTTRRARRVFGPRCYPPYGRLNRWERQQVNEIRYWERVKGCR